MKKLYWLLLAAALAAPSPAQQQPQPAQKKTTAKPLKMAKPNAVATQANAAEAAKPGTAATPANTAQAAKAEAVAPPANAEKIGDGVYKATDTAGKTWIYTRTPFGYSKVAESEHQAAGNSVQSAALQVVSIDGDKVKFQRDTPFGKSVWTRAKSELSEDEKAALEANRNNSKSTKQDK